KFHADMISLARLTSVLFDGKSRQPNNAEVKQIREFCIESGIIEAVASRCHFGYIISKASRAVFPFPVLSVPSAYSITIWNGPIGWSGFIPILSAPSLKTIAISKQLNEFVLLLVFGDMSGSAPISAGIVEKA